MPLCTDPSVFTHPSAVNGATAHDVAIIKFASAITGRTPLPIDPPSTGQATLVGYGQTQLGVAVTRTPTRKQLRLNVTTALGFALVAEGVGGSTRTPRRRRPSPNDAPPQE